MSTAATEVVFAAEPGTPDHALTNQGHQRNRNASGKENDEQLIMSLVAEARADTRPDADGRLVGALAPVTLMNFNVFELKLPSPINLTVPACGKGSRTLEITHKGRVFPVSYMVVRAPKVNPKLEGFVKNKTGDEVTADRKYSLTTPLMIGCEFVDKYTGASFKPCGGVLLFDQDQHEIGSRLASRGGRIRVPERKLDQYGKRFIYTYRETTLDDELDRVLEQQRVWMNARLNEAHNWYQSEDIMDKRNITDTHREINRWAKLVGYVDNLEPWTLEMVGKDAQASERVSCRGCGTQRKVQSALFCEKCNRPYDALAAYKAGEVVPAAFLDALQGSNMDAWEEYMTIKAEREQLALVRQAEFTAKAASKASSGGTAKRGSGGKFTAKTQEPKPEVAAATDQGV